MARRNNKRVEKNANEKVKKESRRRSGNKKNKTKPRRDSRHKESEKKTKLYSDRSQLQTNPTSDFGGKKSTKKTDKKTKTERKESKEANLGVLAAGTVMSPVETSKTMSRRETKRLTRETEKRMEELGQDGIIILVDQPNLEIGKSKKMREEKLKENPELGDDERCIVRYGRLKGVVAQGRSGKENRKVLKTCVVTSKVSQRGAGYQLSKRLQKRHNIEYLVSPIRTVGGREKVVDAMVVRRMVEEYAALDIFRSQGMDVPKRTFCLLSADSDFVDVVKAAREKGFDVELWYFKGDTGFSDLKWKGAEPEPEKCESGKCGGLKKADLNKYADKVLKCTDVKEDRDCSVVTGSSLKWAPRR